MTSQAVATTGAVARLVGSAVAPFSPLEPQLDSFEGKVARAAARACDSGDGEGDASLALGGNAEAGHVDEAAHQPVKTNVARNYDVTDIGREAGRKAKTEEQQIDVISRMTWEHCGCVSRDENMPGDKLRMVVCA